MRLVGVLLVPNASTADHASNYVALSVSDGTTTLWSWSTQTSGDGALTEGTPAGVSPYATVTAIKALTASASGSQGIDQDGSYKVATVHSGTGAAIDATVVLIAEPISA